MKKEIIVSAVIAAVLAEDRINSVEVGASQGEFRNTYEVRNTTKDSVDDRCGFKVSSPW